MVLVVVWQEHIPPDQLLRQLALWLQIEFAEDVTKAETQLRPSEATNNPD
jgi:hypothetical protein